jgi:cysteine synthase A
MERAMVEKAREITLETGGFWTDQLNNRDQLTAYHRVGEEILDQTGGGAHPRVRA